MKTKWLLRTLQWGSVLMLTLHALTAALFTVQWIQPFAKPSSDGMEFLQRWMLIMFFATLAWGVVSAVYYFMRDVLDSSDQHHLSTTITSINITNVAILIYNVSITKTALAEYINMTVVSLPFDGAFAYFCSTLTIAELAVSLWHRANLIMDKAETKTQFVQLTAQTQLMEFGIVLGVVVMEILEAFYPNIYGVKLDWKVEPRTWIAWGIVLFLLLATASLTILKARRWGGHYTFDAGMYTLLAILALSATWPFYFRYRTRAALVGVLLLLPSINRRLHPPVEQDLPPPSSWVSKTMIAARWVAVPLLFVTANTCGKRMVCFYDDASDKNAPYHNAPYVVTILAVLVATHLAAWFRLRNPQRIWNLQIFFTLIWSSFFLFFSTFLWLRLLLTPTSQWQDKGWLLGDMMLFTLPLLASTFAASYESQPDQRIYTALPLAPAHVAPVQHRTLRSAKF